MPVTNVHMMGDIEVMGDGGLQWLKDYAGLGARCAVGTTTNARCFDFAHCRELGQDEGEAAKEHELIGCLRRMDVVTTDTCINYQTVYQPHLGEHVAWGDTGTVIYANSVFGARSNFESGPAALAAGITGRTPEYGFHLDAHRKGNFTVELRAKLDDLADWGMVGKLVGEPHQSYFSVPVFHSARRTPTADELKHLGAALASYGSMGMFHYVDVTPEAPSLEAALGGREPAERLVITDADLERAYAGYESGRWRCALGGVLRAAAVAVRNEAARGAVRRQAGEGRLALLRHHQRRGPRAGSRAGLCRDAGGGGGDDPGGSLLLHPAKILTEGERHWFGQWLTDSQVLQGIKKASKYQHPNKRFVILQVLEAARIRAEKGLPPYGDLLEPRSGPGRRPFIKGLTRLQR